ncbi:Dabb family protein [Luethyella okanaganae]|uniref:Dabb family protein n=1 Tax=Luethyella okanaganae TaxID=69372 RepID=A0ABW1VH55_9MICO
MTIRHVVTWKLAESDPSERAAQAERIVAALEALPAQISDIRSLQVGVNSIGPERNWDVVLIADYDDAAALERYQVHPAHLPVVGLIKPLTAERSCVDFELVL